MILIVGGLGQENGTSPGVSWGPGGGAVPGPGAWDTGALRPPCAGPLPDLEELMGLRAVICNEVGCGLVPIQAEERQRREAVGRLCCQLAERAEAVYRISCGLAIRLK